MEVHKLKPNFSWIYLDNSPNICSISSEVVRGFYYMFDNEKIGIIYRKTRSIITFGFDERAEMVERIREHHNSKLAEEAREVFDLFKDMSIGGRNTWPK